MFSIFAVGIATLSGQNIQACMDAAAHFSIKKMSPQFVVVNIGNSISFYTKTLGFELEFEYEGFYAGIVKDGCSIHLKSGNPSPRKQNEDLDIVFSIEGVEELYRKLSAEHIEFVQHLRDAPYGKEFYIADPDGYIIAFLTEA